MHHTWSPWSAPARCFTKENCSNDPSTSRPPNPNQPQRRSPEMTPSTGLENISMTAAAATYSIEKQRRINGGQPTLLLDEMDTRFGEGRSDEDLRQIIDSGFEQGGTVTKTVRVNGKYEAHDFAVYGPMAIAGKMDITQVPSTIRTRSIIVQMQKRAPDEKVQRWNKRRSPKE